jgi:hypothetical protein
MDCVGISWIVENITNIDAFREMEKLGTLAKLTFKLDYQKE